METHPARDNVILQPSNIRFEHKAGSQARISLTKIASERMGTNPLLHASL